LKKLQFLIFLSIAMLNGSISSYVNSATISDIQPLTKLVRQIQNGGYILYMRHAPTEPKTADKNKQVKDGSFSVDFANCKTQRNLSEKGKEVAKALKKHFKRLHIPVGKVSTSPYCRTLDTAKMVFENYVIDPNLAYSLSEEPEESVRLGQYLVAEFIAANTEQTNAVFVGHSTNLREGLGIWPKPEGVVAVFKKSAGNIIYLGMITPTDWLSLERVE